MKKTIYIILGYLIITACEPTLIAEFEDKPVVYCYLEAGTSPILTVAKLIAFRDDVVYSDEDVNRLSITVTDETEGKNYQLQSIGDGKYENSQLIAQTGHTYSLNFIYNNSHISATTSVPEAPQNVEFSATSAGVFGSSYDVSTRAETGPGQGIVITWNNDERNYYIVEGFTTSTTLIRSSSTTPDKSFKLDYTQSNTITLSQMQFHYIGNYEISLIRILKEYAVMSQGSSETSTSLVDIKGNIDGGYGIFTGINRVKQNINIYRQTSPF